MMKCKECGQKLSKLDRDICPFCGCRKPLEGMEDVTQDFTMAFTPVEIEKKEIKRKSKLIAALLSIFLGFFGATGFYLGKYKQALIQIAFSFIIVGGFGCLFFFTCLENALAFVIPGALVLCLNIAYGIRLLVSNSITDKNGEFLK